MSAAAPAPLRAVSVVVPTHDGLRFLRRCIPALRRSRLPPSTTLQIVVVDNGSRDGSQDWLRAEAGVDAVFLPRPSGFAHANNAARSVARGEVVVFLNNDTEVEPEWLLRPLEILASDPTVAAVGSRLVFLHDFVKIQLRTGGRTAFVAAEHYGMPLDDKVRWAGPAGGLEVRHGGTGRVVGDGAVLYLPIPLPDLDGIPARDPVVSVRALDGPGEVRIEAGDRARSLSRFPGVAVLPLDGVASVRLIQNAGSFVRADGGGGDVGTGVEDGPDAFATEDEVPSICGAALMARRTALDAAGWFPGYYTMYYEDTDLCLRLRSAGGRLVYCPSSVVRHYHTGSSREWSPTFIRHVARSSLLFLTRFGGPRLVARTLRNRVVEVRRDLRRAGGWTPWTRWRNAYATRGTAAAIPVLPRVLAARLLGRAERTVRGAAPRAPLLGMERTRYQPAGGEHR